MRVFEYSQRVYFSDTDAQGIVYHASYLDFAEHARTELARTLGTSGLEGNRALVVKSITISYEKAAKLDDLLTVYTTLKEHGHFSMTFGQTIKRGEETVADLTVKVGSIDLESGRPLKISDSLLAALQ